MIILGTPCPKAADLHDQAWLSRDQAGKRPAWSQSPGTGGRPSGMMKICEETPAPGRTEVRRAIHGDAERAQEPPGARSGRRAPARPGGRADAAARAARVHRPAEPGDAGRGRLAAPGGRGPDPV